MSRLQGYKVVVEPRAAKIDQGCRFQLQGFYHQWCCPGVADCGRDGTGSLQDGVCQTCGLGAYASSKVVRTQGDALEVKAVECGARGCLKQVEAGCDRNDLAIRGHG